MTSPIDKYINTIICGDCLDILKDFPDSCVDLVVTDPPWNLGYFKDDDKEWDTYADGNFKLVNIRFYPVK